jgi:hypothetical protein
MNRNTPSRVFFAPIAPASLVSRAWSKFEAALAGRRGATRASNPDNNLRKAITMKQLSQLEVQQVSGGVDGQQPAISVIDSPLPYIVLPVYPPRLIKGPIGLEP